MCVFAVITNCSTNNGDCEEICVVSDNEHGRSCLCRDHFMPDPTDDRKCVEGTHTHHTCALEHSSVHRINMYMYICLNYTDLHVIVFLYLACAHCCSY